MINPIISTHTPTKKCSGVRDPRAGVRDPRARLIGAVPDITLFTYWQGARDRGWQATHGKNSLTNAAPRVQTHDVQQSVVGRDRLAEVDAQFLPSHRTCTTPHPSRSANARAVHGARHTQHKPLQPTQPPPPRCARRKRTHELHSRTIPSYAITAHVPRPTPAGQPTREPCTARGTRSTSHYSPHSRRHRAAHAGSVLTPYTAAPSHRTPSPHMYHAPPQPVSQRGSRAQREAHAAQATTAHTAAATALRTQEAYSRPTQPHHPIVRHHRTCTTAHPSRSANARAVHSARHTQHKPLQPTQPPPPRCARRKRTHVLHSRTIPSYAITAHVPRPTPA
eukprot:COSAG01_NODE_3840_length_5646_cov_13.756805_7_plen_335_part_01